MGMGNRNYADRRPLNCAEFTVVKCSESDPLTFAELFWEYSSSPTEESSTLFFFFAQRRYISIRFVNYLQQCQILHIIININNNHNTNTTTDT